MATPRTPAPRTHTRRGLPVFSRDPASRSREPASPVVEEIRASRLRADRILDRTAMSPARSLFNQEIGELSRSLRKTERGRLLHDADPSMVRRVWRASASHVNRMTTRLSNELIASTRDSLTESLRGLMTFTGKVTGSAGPLDDEAVFRSLVSQQRASIETARRLAMVELERRINDRILSRLLEVSATEGSKVRDMLSVVNEEMEANWWQIERIVRTESSVAYNSAQLAGVKELAKSHKGIMLRWTELIDDATGQPFDTRVAVDSFVMHGQVSPVGGVFTMPPSLPRGSAGKKASGSFEQMVGMSWSQPPNRPNDRAVLTPWMREWGIPGWRYQNGRRVNLRPKT